MERLAVTTTDWNLEAKKILRAELKSLKLSYKGLSEFLAESGVIETPENLKTKIARGTFSAGFFIQCLSAMQVPQIEIPRFEGVKGPPKEAAEWE